MPNKEKTKEQVIRGDEIEFENINGEVIVTNPDKLATGEYSAVVLEESVSVDDDLQKVVAPIVINFKKD